MNFMKTKKHAKLSDLEDHVRMNIETSLDKLVRSKEENIKLRRVAKAAIKCLTTDVIIPNGFDKYSGEAYKELRNSLYAIGFNDD